MIAISCAAGTRRRFRVLAGALIGGVLGLAIGMVSGKPSDALAGTCGPQPSPPPAGTCQRGWLCSPDSYYWEPTYFAPGTPCSLGNPCITNERCQFDGSCQGTPTCPPGVPGPMSGPTGTVTDGAYTLNWGEASFIVDRYELFENGLNIATTAPRPFSYSVADRTDGTYRYNVRACNTAGCGAFTADYFVTVLWPPGMPGWSSSFPSDGGPNYTVSWTPQPLGPPAPPGSGRSDRYDLNESTDGVNWPTNYPLTANSKSFAGRPQGSRFWYRVRACNASGCSGYTGTKSVDVVSSLTTVAEQAPPTFVPPDQGWVGTGTIPGTPSAEGGAATYRIPIEVPPGRAGMQPEIALTYSSRNGNGVAGVGWSLSASRTIYRCPNTFAQDGRNRPVMYDGGDALCFDGQRLVGSSLSYGMLNSEYRTEVDQFDRITLKGGDTNSLASYFEVEHKSGRISHFAVVVGGPAEIWYLVREFDRQGNCTSYEYAANAWRGTFPERVLTRILYTGTRSGDQCTFPAADARSVEFQYTNDREDKRTTYRFSVALPMTARLAAIQTKVGASPVRRYELAYKMSTATRRSLLDNVTLCAGAACGVEKLRPTTFTYQEEPQTFDRWHVFFNNQTLDANWRAASVADFDGDGTRDHVYDYFDPVNGTRTRYLDMTVCGKSTSVVPALSANRQLRFQTTGVDVKTFEGSEDINDDGRADMIGVTEAPRYMFFETVKGCNLYGNRTVTNLPLDYPGDTDIFAWAPIDYDGDGIIDLHYWKRTAVATNPPTNPPTYTYMPAGDRIVRRRTKDLSDWTVNVQDFAAPTAPTTSMAPQMARDLNGDGFVDTVFDNGVGSSQATQIAFYRGPALGGYTYRLLTSLGGPGGAFSDHTQRRWIDVNGDGLPDIYEPGIVYINQGGDPSYSTMFRAVPVAMPPSSSPQDPANWPLRAMYAFSMDFDADGREELMVPNVRTIAWCGGDGSRIGDGYAWFCGNDFDTAPSGWRSADKSVFRWNAYKFVEMSDGSYSMIAVPTNLEAPVNTAVGTNPADWNGDGMTDVRFHLANFDVNNYYDGLTAADLGPYVSRGQSRAPDLLTGVTNGLAAAASWQHQPLSQQDAVAGCDMHGDKFYVAHHDDPNRSPGYAYFTSSMWTVSRFEVSNGLGAGTNKTCYRYQDAMLNSEGRGFQGFKVIVAEEQMPPAAGEPTDSTVTCLGATCSVNNLRTKTEFHQEFPLTSKVKKVTVALAKSRSPDETILSDTTYWWHADNTHSSLGAWLVYSSASVDLKSELPPAGATAARLSTQTTTASEIDPVSGDTARACVLVRGPSATATDVIKVDTRTIENNVSIWWLGKVTSRTMLTDFFGGSFAPNSTCLISGNSQKACSATPPTCPSVSATPDAKQQATSYVWYDDPVQAPGSPRKLKSETLLRESALPATTAPPPGSIERQTTFDYGQFGNVSAMHVNQVRDVVGELLTTYTYTADGYFLATETNPVGHVATIETDAKTGVVLSRQPVQRGPKTKTIPDDFGRILTVQTVSDPASAQNPLGASQPAETRLSAYAVGNCVARRTTFQVGAPTKTEYLDRVSRVIGTGIEGFDEDPATMNAFEIITKVSYNARGVKISEHQPFISQTPWFAGGWDCATASPYRTEYSGIDALGRVGTKQVFRDATLFEPGRGDPVLTTTYSYSPVTQGVTTTIAVSTLSMTRTYDRRGKLVQTTQVVSTPATHTISINYLYDPAGNLTTILDSSTTGNPLTSTYDYLGRKTAVVDPDRGRWTYAWDGLGRLETETDARLYIVSQDYDGIGRMIKRYVQKPADASRVLDASWQYDLNNRPGTLGAVASNDNVAAGADNFHREYLYDALWRPFRVTTHVPASSSLDWAARDFAVEYGYDHGYGRMKAMGYPGPNGGTIGEMVALDYDARGNLLGETLLAPDGSRGTTAYRVVTAMSVRGQVSFQKLGKWISESSEYDGSTGLAKKLSAYGLADAVPAGCPPDPFLLVREDDYTYDQFLNLAVQKKQFVARSGSTMQFSGCTPVGLTTSETYQYDDLQRLLSESRSWNGMLPAPGTSTLDRYAYDDLGNITMKDDYADLYTYGSKDRTVRNAGPHAVLSVSKGSTVSGEFTYDANGNLTSSTGVDARSVDFDGLDRPTTVKMPPDSAGAVPRVVSQFRYAPDGTRYLQRTTGSPSSPTEKTVYYVDKNYEQIVWSSGTMEERTYIGGSVIVRRVGATRDVFYRHQDRLGSSDALTNAGGFEVTAEAHGYDAFGRPRGRDWQPSSDKLHPNGDYGAITELGFTKHEHLDDTYLIHMNGRVYDYRLGRFLSVDPIISNPANSQSINPYSYIGNNPLSGVDPTGYDVCPAGQVDKCEGARPEPPKEQTKQSNSMVAARKEGSIAGRAGDNTSVNGFDQNTAAGKAVIAASRSNGAAGQGTKSGCTNGTDCGSPQETGQRTKGAGNASAGWLGDGSALDRDIRDLLAGKISETEYWDRIEARAAGATAGLALDALVFGGAKALGAAASAAAARLPTAPVEEGVEALARVVNSSGGSIRQAIAAANTAGLGQSQAVEALTRVIQASGRSVGGVVDVTGGARVLTGIIPGAGQPIVHISASGTATFGSANVTFAIDAAGKLVTTVTNIVLH